MHILLMVGILLAPSDSLTLVEKCEREAKLIAKIEVCREALKETRHIDSLFLAVVFDEIEPTLDTLVAQESDIRALLKTNGVGRLTRWSIYAKAAWIEKFHLAPAWRGLKADTDDPDERERFIKALGFVTALANDIRATCTTCPEDLQ